MLGGFKSVLKPFEGARKGGAEVSFVRNFLSVLRFKTFGLVCLWLNAPVSNFQ